MTTFFSISYKTNLGHAGNSRPMRDQTFRHAIRKLLTLDKSIFKYVKMILFLFSPILWSDPIRICPPCCTAGPQTCRRCGLYTRHQRNPKFKIKYFFFVKYGIRVDLSNTNLKTINAC